MRCAPGTHEAAQRLISRHVRPDARALDVAAGTGAFLARLRSAGFSNLSAIELNVQEFSFPGVEPVAVDLNTPFADAMNTSYDLITAIEIVEHLDCPRSFLYNIRQLLSDEGILLLTTPNIAHWLGRVRFMMSGELRQFQRHDYNYQRHISPVTDVQMRLIFEELGFDLLEATTAGTFFGPLKQAIFWPIEMIMRLMMGPRASGDVALYLVRKSASTTESAGRDSFYFRKTGA